MSKKEKEALAKEEEKIHQLYLKIKKNAEIATADIKDPKQQAQVLNLLRADI